MFEQISLFANTIASKHARTRFPTAVKRYTPKPRRAAPWYIRLRQRRLSMRKVCVYLVSAFVLVFSTPAMPTYIAGVVLAGLGLVLRLWAFGHLEKSTHMVTTGPYAYTRNPAYLGSFLVMCGVVVAAGDPFSLAGLLVWGIGLVAAVVFFRFYLPRKYAREYPRLEKKFPQIFAAHAANVPDFLPRLTPWRSGDPRRFSWARVRANHELFWSVLLCVALVLVWFV